MVKKKVLVYDGLVKGYNYITKEEAEDRKRLQKEQLNKYWWVIILLCLLIAAPMIILMLFG